MTTRVLCAPLHPCLPKRFEDLFLRLLPTIELSFKAYKFVLKELQGYPMCSSLDLAFEVGNGVIQ